MGTTSVYETVLKGCCQAMSQADMEIRYCVDLGLVMMKAWLSLSCLIHGLMFMVLEILKCKLDDATSCLKATGGCLSSWDSIIIFSVKMPISWPSLAHSSW